MYISGVERIAFHFSQDLMNNIFVDLDFLGCKKDGTTAGMYTKGAEVLTEPCKKRRKHSSITGSFQEQPAKDGLEVEMQKNLNPISVKIAALEALETLLTMGGSLKSESWRTNVDHLIITVATNACKGGWSKEERNAFLSGEPWFIWADFQLAALRALLASLLLPGRTRPSHLALGLELFRTGIQERGTKLAEYCGHALLTLEVLIHPRSLPLSDTHSSFSDDYKGLSQKFPDTMYTSRQRQASTFQNRTLDKDTCEPESEDDDLNDNWLENDNVEMEIQVTDMQENAVKPYATLSNSVKGKGLMYESENELSTDLIPDIVDGDPDSD